MWKRFVFQRITKQKVCRCDIIQALFSYWKHFSYTMQYSCFRWYHNLKVASSFKLWVFLYFSFTIHKYTDNHVCERKEQGFY